MQASAPAADVDAFNKKLTVIEGLIAKRELQQAADRLNTLVRSAPGHPLPYVLGMKLAEAAGNPDAARQSAERAVQCAPGWPGGVMELAALRGRQGEPAEALTLAQRAVALAPQDFATLTRAIDIAHGTNDFAAALPWLRTATALAPQDGLVARALVRNLAQQGQFDEALERVGPLIDAEPDDLALRADRAIALLRSGAPDRARADTEHLVQAEPDNPLYRFWHQHALGETPAIQPEALVVGLFDGMAAQFDMQLVRGLQYDTPQRVAERIRALHPDLKLNVLDLGCGTGLLGLYLGRIDGFLIGVDLSQKMIDQAARHNVYDRFHRVNLVDALQATPESLYQVVAACDVFIYVGALDQVLAGALRVLTPGGHFIFSCEQAEEDGPDYVLRATMRYAHKASAVRAQAEAAGFEHVDTEFLDLRLEAGEPVRGFHMVLRKPA